jgi:hypothetical protein
MTHVVRCTSSTQWKCSSRRTAVFRQADVLFGPVSRQVWHHQLIPALFQLLTNDPTGVYSLCFAMATSGFLLPTNPSLSTVQVLSSTNFAPIGFAFPTDGRGVEAVVTDLKYAWTEIRRWHRSFAILCDEAEDEDILVS